MEFKTYNDKDYEKDAFCRIFEKILFLIICPILILLLPFMIIDDIKNENIPDVIIEVIILLISIWFILFAISV